MIRCNEKSQRGFENNERLLHMVKIELCMTCSLPEYTNIKTRCICHQMVYNLCPHAKVVEQDKRKRFHSRDRR